MTRPAERAGEGSGLSPAHCSVGFPAWVPCYCCQEYVCTIHKMHAFECPRPPIEEWGDVDPYSAGGPTLAPGRTE